MLNDLKFQFGTLVTALVQKMKNEAVTQDWLDLGI